MQLYKVLLVIGILLNLGVVAMLATEKKATMAVTVWEPYTSSAGFSAKYPKDWKQEESQKEVMVGVRFTAPDGTFLSAKSSLKGALVVDLLKFNPGNKEPPMETYHDHYLENLKVGMLAFKVTEPTTPIRIHDVEAYRSGFTYMSTEGLMARPMRGVIISTWNGENHLALMFACPEKEYDQRIGLFHTFLQSLKARKHVDVPAGPEMPMQLPI